MDCGLSLGVDVVEQVAVTYGEILYYSVPMCILTSAFLVLCILIGRKRVLFFLRGILAAFFGNMEIIFSWYCFLPPCA